MITKIFSVLDTKGCFFGQPFYDQREASAVRSFGDAVNDGSNPNNQWHKHPEDFQLFLIGEFDNETGHITGVVPKALVSGNSLMEYGEKQEQFEFDKNTKEKKPL